MTFKRKEVIERCTPDCVDILPTIEKSQAVVTDPPYGIDRANGMGKGGKGGKDGRWVRKPKSYAGDWDRERPTAETFSLVLNAGEQHIIWGGNYFSDCLPPSARWLFWDKLNAMPSYSDGEMAWSSLEGNSVKKFTYCSNGLGSKRDGERQHPTQKPVALMSWCLSFLPAGSSVVDPFMGSGTTGVACVRAGMPFIGIERDEAYFEIACQRIRDAHVQSDFFTRSAPAAPDYEQQTFLGCEE